MSTDPSDSTPTPEPTLHTELPPEPPEPPRLQREALLVVQDRSRMALLVGLCTLAGVAAGFALATVAYGARAVSSRACEPAVAPVERAPIPVQPMPYGPGSGHGHGGGRWHGHGHGHGPGIHLWNGDDHIDIDVNRGAKAWLGVTTVTDQAGARVTAVSPGSPAAQAGLAVDDIITEVDGEQIATPGQLAAVIGGLEPGKKVAMKLLRGGKETRVEATVADRP